MTGTGGAVGARAVRWEHGRCGGSTRGAVGARAVRWEHERCGGRPAAHVCIVSSRLRGASPSWLTSLRPA
eukprot:2464422-Prymnesium_polylepis.1